MPRKLAIVVAALIVPGGLIALFGAALFRALQKTHRGRKVIDLARRRVPGWPVAMRWAGLRPAA